MIWQYTWMATMLGHQYYRVSGNMLETYITYSKYDDMSNVGAIMVVVYLALEMF